MRESEDAREERDERVRMATRTLCACNRCCTRIPAAHYPHDPTSTLTSYPPISPTSISPPPLHPSTPQHQSFLVDLYLDCPPGLDLHCPTAAAAAALAKAVKAGDVTWHAWPNNAELALAQPIIVAAGVALTHALDDRLGVPRKVKTDE